MSTKPIFIKSYSRKTGLNPVTTHDFTQTQANGVSGVVTEKGLIIDKAQQLITHWNAQGRGEYVYTIEIPEPEQPQIDIEDLARSATLAALGKIDQSIGNPDARGPLGDKLAGKLHSVIIQALTEYTEKD